MFCTLNMIFFKIKNNNLCRCVVPHQLFGLSRCCEEGGMSTLNVRQGNSLQLHSVDLSDAWLFPSSTPSGEREIMEAGDWGKPQTLVTSAPYM